jgi:dinuclear metal center YbgI/SA1388 family protein
MSVKAERLFGFIDSYLGTQDFPDYPTALNGLQVEGPAEIGTVGVAVDASLETIRKARAAGLDLLIVHHGLFWGGLQPLTGPAVLKIREVIEGGLAVYSSHLPLDAHPEVGNSAVLCRALGIEPEGRFGSYQGVQIGWRGSSSSSLEELEARAAEVLGGRVRMIGAPGRRAAGNVAVVTGAGAGFLRAAAENGVDTLVTGEAPHHAYHEARELGVNLLLGGHYATETWGVRALAELLEAEFGLPWQFIDCPTGL